MTQLELVFVDKEEVRPTRYKAVDFESFNLIYFRKEDKVKFLVKRITCDDYVVIDSEKGTIEKINRYTLRKLFIPNKKVNKINKKVARLTIGRMRNAG